ncbi:IGF2BP2 [Mytilus edulis]|uniref:IGF2BP2 n=1 Tax=Mytilus edulis TaxID=6550 RepID=A0A8S3TLQ0_MYTED|nr:IGF2BP2 [Mytilus edulis]
MNKAFTVPKHFAGRVIGKCGHAIRDVIKKSSVKEIEIQNKKENAVVIFNIIGSQEAIQRAERMLNIKLDSIEEVLLKESIICIEHVEVKHKVKNHRNQKLPMRIALCFFLENKIFRRIDYVKKQKQKQRALLKLGKGNVKIQLQGQRQLSKRELDIDFQLHSVPSFTENKQCEDQHKCSKKKTVKTNLKIYIIETEHGPIKLSKARFHDNCLGKYIEAAIKNKGLNGALTAASWTDCDVGSGTWISLDSPEFLNEKGEICFECIENESNRRREQQLLEHIQTQVKAKVKRDIIDHGQTNFSKAKFQDICHGKYDYRGTGIILDSHEFFNKKREIYFLKCKEIENKREDEQSWWMKPQPTKDSWEEWDSDEESSISTELDNFKISVSTELEQFMKDMTNARYNCPSDSLI